MGISMYLGALLGGLRCSGHVKGGPLWKPPHQGSGAAVIGVAGTTDAFGPLVPACKQTRVNCSLYHRGLNKKSYHGPGFLLNKPQHVLGSDLGPYQ